MIFMTDNGPQQRRYVAGMRGLKGSVYRGGVRVPFFIRYPALKRTNTEIEETAAHIDVLPTLATICNAELPLAGKNRWNDLGALINGQEKKGGRGHFSSTGQGTPLNCIIILH